MTWKKYIYKVLQCLVGALFIFSGLSKGVDPVGTAIKIGEYAVSFGLPIGSEVAMIASIALNLFEALLGFALLLGIYPKQSSLLSLIFIIPMTLLTLYIYIFNPVADCGCFGDALKISNAATFWKNVVLSVVIYALYRRPETFYRIYPKRYDAYLGALSALLLLYFNLYPLRHLPVIDWRPYKLGASIAELTGSHGAEGAFDYTFVYEREGEQRVFTMEELADIDSTWHYVSTEVVELAAPTEPLGADFILLDSEGQNWVPFLEEGSAPTLLYLVLDAHKITDEQWAVGLNAAEAMQVPIWLVVSNRLEEVSSIPQVGAFDKVLSLDRSTSLTVIRSHPGMVYVEEGKIQDKRSFYDLKRLVKQGALEEALSGDNPKDDLKQCRKSATSPLLIYLGTLLLTAPMVWRRESTVRT